MKRYPLVISATAAGLAGVLSFHSHSATTTLQGGASATSASPGSSHSTAPASTTSAKGTTAPATTSSAKGTTAPASTTSAKGPTPGKSAPASASGQGGSSTHATGTLEQYGYGQLSVRVTMSGGKIANVAVAKLQTADTYSQQLASYVIPILRREVLHAQSAKINGLTGATYTSEAYAYSLQSALDKLRK